ncbi:MAG: hypothetical protein H7Y03_04530 [Chitinophagaceae bacterium]|nr:hypothetical protein [Chitinophagaceae bacterium]
MNSFVNKLPLILLFFVTLTIVSCEDDPLPLNEAITTSDYYGEWKGVSLTTRAFTSGTISETSLPLLDVLSLRKEDGKDTFNFKDLSTGSIMPKRKGTWYVTQINDNNNAELNGTRILRLRVDTLAARLFDSTYTIKEVDAKRLVLYQAPNKTLIYSK